MSSILELTDWIVTHTSVRGSSTGDGGNWQHASVPPTAWDPIRRLVWRADGVVFRIDDKPCTAMKNELREGSEKVLRELPLPSHAQRSDARLRAEHDARKNMR